MEKLKDEKINEIWEKANESERHGFAFGLFPLWVAQYNLNNEETAELIRKAQKERGIVY